MGEPKLDCFIYLLADAKDVGERAANQSRWRGTHLVLNQTVLYRVIQKKPDKLESRAQKE